MAVDPWGRVVLSLKGVREKKSAGGAYEVEDGAVGELGVVDVDLGVWEKVREQMPLVRRTYAISFSFPPLLSLFKSAQH
ncbi:hypothetical protein PC116_g33829 [Phytophthora cactorum]|nr:hypothetical protein PC116_g33829 [Phytophthora cactorum]